MKRIEFRSKHNYRKGEDTDYIDVGSSIKAIFKSTIIIYWKEEIIYVIEKNIYIFILNIILEYCDLRTAASEKCLNLPPLAAAYFAYGPDSI